MIAGADHFFRDKIDLLSEEIDDYLRGAFDHQAEKVKGKATSPKKKKAPQKIFLE